MSLSSRSSRAELFTNSQSLVESFEGASSSAPDLPCEAARESPQERASGAGSRMPWDWCVQEWSGEGA